VQGETLVEARAPVGEILRPRVAVLDDAGERRQALPQRAAGFGGDGSCGLVQQRARTACRHSASGPRAAMTLRSHPCPAPAPGCRGLRRRAAARSPATCLGRRAASPVRRRAAPPCGPRNRRRTAAPGNARRARRVPAAVRSAPCPSARPLRRFRPGPSRSTSSWPSTMISRRAARAAGAARCRLNSRSPLAKWSLSGLLIYFGSPAPWMRPAKPTVRPRASSTGIITGCGRSRARRRCDRLRPAARRRQRFGVLRRRRRRPASAARSPAERARWSVDARASSASLTFVSAFSCCANHSTPSPARRLHAQPIFALAPGAKARARPCRRTPPVP
jgi:hypothetical protein